MEVKAGYKQTEVGVIPSDWKVIKLAEVSELMTNGFVGTATNHYTEDRNGVLYIQGFNVEENKFNFTGIKKVSQAFHRAHQKSCLRTGDLLTIQTGDVGLTTVVPEELAGSNCHALIITRLNSKKANPNFFSSYLNSKTGRSRLRLLETGTTMKHLNVGDVLQYQMPLPPLPEQQAIANALSDADALIESLEQLIEKKRQIKQGVMQELLTGTRRLPGFSGEWEKKRLGEIGEALIGLTYKPSDVSESGILVLRSSNVYQARLRFEDNVFVQMEIPEKILVKNGDILICVRNGSRDLIGKCAKIERDFGNITFGAFMAVFRTPYHEFVYHQFQSEMIQRQIHEHLGATINQITNRSLNSFQIKIPTDLAEQAAIASVLSKFNSEIDSLKEKLVKVIKVKQAMMQELLTGKVRLV